MKWNEIKTQENKIEEYNKKKTMGRYSFSIDEVQSFIECCKHFIEQFS